jgi:branched-chain amino acid transport system ATP-binding protein
MSPSETDRMAELILDIQTEFRIAMILVEHDMHLVMDLAERVVALNFGELLAVGTPEVVASDESVIHSYLGSAEV